MRRNYIISSLVAFAVVIGLLVGLGVGLTRDKSTDDLSDSSPSNLSSPSGTSSTLSTSASSSTISSSSSSELASLWTPLLNETWDYQLLLVPTTFNSSIRVYDIDLFDTNSSVVKSLHNQGHKVICYFSAGSYENWRPDKDKFLSSDLGNNLDGWPGERWLDVKSTNVRDIMVNRMALAVEKKCDGVDPDNIDAYDNDNGLGLTEDDAVDYVRFLSSMAHQKKLAIGLKNGGSIVDRVVNATEWVVVEQCIQYDECDLYDLFVKANKPVFNVEYPGLSSLSASDVSKYCQYSGSVGFMTILKNMNLDNWVESCGFRSPM
ncbi:CIC11C00000002237 [Sungouiella intermedia]|uniref:alpha-galactosidase n=1 Tax=Sungouiella intermedia TaxID=45354 RepID=A0A1L0DS76_9ASCO|nr:CIC11C00000002237 [[Candida] intermedia]